MGRLAIFTLEMRVHGPVAFWTEEPNVSFLNLQFHPVDKLIQSVCEINADQTLVVLRWHGRNSITMLGIQALPN